jgi:predicted HTH domain antitoxin
MTKTLTTRAPDTLAKEIDNIAKEEHLDRSSLIRRLLADAVKEWRKSKALSMYSERKVSIGKAADIAKLSIWEMLDLIKEKGLHIDYTLTALEEDLEPLRRKLSARSESDSK